MFSRAVDLFRQLSALVSRFVIKMFTLDHTIFRCCDLDFRRTDSEGIKVDFIPWLFGISLLDNA